MKKQLIPLFCLFHFFALFWWTIPQSFSDLVAAHKVPNSLEANLLQHLKLDKFPTIQSLLQRYIDVSASQQYWDFFAPHSPKYHQYFSVCNAVITYAEQEIIECKGKPLLTNLEDNFIRFEHFGSDRSRLYRLTENLTNIEDKQLLDAFTRYYKNIQQHNSHENTQAILVLHQFELHPELTALPKAGYRSDKILWSIK